MVSELISSEESDENDSIIVRPLPWRAPKVTDFFKKLDVLIDEDKTSLTSTEGSCDEFN